MSTIENQKMNLKEFKTELKKEITTCVINTLAQKKDEVISFAIYTKPRANYIGFVYNTKKNLEEQIDLYKNSGEENIAFLKWDVNEWKMDLPYSKDLTNWLESKAKELDGSDLENHIKEIFEIITDTLLELKKQGLFKVFDSEFLLALRTHDYTLTVSEAIPMIRLLGVKKYQEFYTEYVEEMCEVC